MNVKCYFPASPQEVKDYPENSTYNLPRLGLFRTASAAVTAVEQHKTEGVYPIVIELSVPSHAIVDHYDPMKISIVRESQSIVSNHLPVSELLGKVVIINQAIEA